jgi:hypothetical protein
LSAEILPFLAAAAVVVGGQWEISGCPGKMEESETDFKSGANV